MVLPKKILTSVLMAITILAEAQTNYHFEYFSSRDGLVSNSVSEMVQDSLGFIWFNAGTHLVRFDGYNFKPYAHHPHDSTSFPGNEQTRLLLDQEGKLWITSSGPARDIGSLMQYDYALDGFRRHKISLESPGARFVYFDRKKSGVWLAGNATSGSGLFLYDMETGVSTHYLNHHNDSETQFLENCILGIQDLDSALLVGTRTGLWMFNKSKHTFTRPQVASEDSSFLFRAPLYILRPGKSSKWLRSFGNLYRLDSQLHPVEMFPATPQRSTGEPDGYDEDADGNIWFANQMGLQLYNRTTQSFSIISDGPASPMANVRLDRDNNVWAFTAGRVVKLKKKIGVTYRSSTTLFAGAVTKNNTGVIAIVGGYAGNLYQVKQDTSGLSGGIAEYDHREAITGRINQITRGRNHYWCALWPQGIMGIEFDVQGLTRNIVAMGEDPDNPNTIGGMGGTGVWEDASGNLWYTSWAGLSKVNLNVSYGKEGSVTRYVHHPADSNSLSHNQLFGLFPDENHSFWVVTAEGLDLFEDGKFFHQRGLSGERPNSLFKSKRGYYYLGMPSGYFVGTKEGRQLKLKKTFLPEVVFSFMEDNHGRIWMIVSSGILIYDPQDGTMTKLDESDGIIESPIKIEQSADGSVLVFGSHGISRINEADIVINTRPVFPALTKILVNNKIPAVGSAKVTNTDDFTIPLEAAVLQELTLDYLHNNFTLEFSAMEMTAPEKNLYKYKLEGYDNDWIETNFKDRTATYTNLPSGTYTFRVKASNHQGVWSNNERTLKVIILPPPWRTWWAYSIYLLSFLVALRAFSKWRERNIQREKENLEIKVEERTYELKSTQAQLIQSEKMASLGELTAGIAHEIQNPLNFVNNFSDVNSELIAEMRTEIEKGNYDEVKALAKDVEENEQKINHHGKRAGDIVKSMLQHSRAGSGVKEPTNINRLADEYLRLAYHGLRAKDKSFSAIMKTDFDETIGTINIIPQDIGRVILNLVTNAFHAVIERQKNTPTVSGGQPYEPTVSVSTKSSGDYVFVFVRDNGNGIPEKVINKIFQPFFTTKPTGQGTGLGLSLSYDIVKAHGGELKVETKEGEGATFSIRLPAR